MRSPSDTFDPFELGRADDVPLAVRAPRRGAARTWRLPVVLFGATLFSTLVVGGNLAGSPYTIFDLDLLLADPGLLAAQLAAGAPFSLTLLAILLAHEFGHFFTARWHGVDATPPHFIPFPTAIGTLGAVIRMRGQIPTRRALVDIGASGPIAGFLLAVPMLFAGLLLSTTGPVEHAPTAWPRVSLIGIVQEFANPAPSAGLLEGTSALYGVAKWLVFGALPEGHDVHLHPVGIAAWFGLFVTMLNLLPVGQLDGGHVLFALLGRRARRVGRLVIAALVVLGVFAWAGWLLWALLAWKVIRTTHPPVASDEPLDRARVAIAWISLAIFVATFLPVPIDLL